MAEVDPYLEKTTNIERVAAKRLRKDALKRGEAARQHVEAKAPAWKNESGGGPISFHPGSFGPHILDNGGHGTRRKGQY